MTEKLRLDIPILLPEVNTAADACVQILIEQIAGKEGVEDAHVVAGVDGEPARLCIHYDPDILPLPRIRDLIAAAGARISERYGHAVWQLDIPHQRRARSIAERLRTLDGVIEAEASATGTVRVEFDRSATSEATLKGKLDKLQTGGARPERDSRADEHAGHDHEGGAFGANTELIFSLLCGALLAGGYLIGKLLTVPAWLPFACYLGAYFFGGLFTLREAIENLRLKKFEIDTLMLVAAAGAAVLGAWAEGALLLFLFSLGHALEHYAMGRAKQAIEALAKLAPRTALVRRDGELREVPVEDLAVGDIVIVKPDLRLPADGFLIKGVSSVNQAPVTGESIPVDKRPVSDADAARANPDKVNAAHRVFAGTINGNGAIEIEVTRKSSDTTLAKVVKMVSEAETQKSPTQRFTDKFEHIFVPVVLALAVILLFAGLVIDEPFRDTFYRAMAVLVAASPCALAIATPSAVLSGVARAARGGVLVKGGAPLENLGSLTAIAFDKTGTLTSGTPRITDIVPAHGVTENELLAVAVAVESLSDHPLARAIARDGRERLGGKPVPEADGLDSLTGRGVSARVGGETVLIGKAEMFGAEGIAPLSDAMQKTIARLREGGPNDNGGPARRPRHRRHRADGYAARGREDRARPPSRTRHQAADHDIWRPSKGCRGHCRSGWHRRGMGRSDAAGQGRGDQEAPIRRQSRHGWRWRQ